MTNVDPDVDILHARHVIGLDIGDGESALVWSSTGDTPHNTPYRRKRTGEVSILTAFSRKADGSCLLGEEAVLADDPVEFRVNFKGHGQANEAFQFGKELLREFFKAHPEVDEENCLIVVGHPAGWPDHAIAEYGTSMSHLGHSVRLLAESQSALVHVWDRERHRELGDVLVVDIGSSTVDFTIVEDMNPRNIDAGADLGCRQIDEQLAAMTKEALAWDAKFAAELASSGGEDMLLLACRIAKEALFAGEVPDEKWNKLRGSREKYAIIRDSGFGYIKNQEITNLVDESGGWKDKFKQLITVVKEQKLQRPPALVILTGGGSRMAFTREVCVKVFKGSDVDRASEPALSVAYGLAIAGRQCVRVAGFRRDIDALVTSDETRAQIHAETENAFRAIKEAIGKAMRRSSYGGPESWLNESWRSLITNPPNHEQVVRDLQDSTSSYLIPRVQKVCAKYGIPEDRFSVNVTLPLLFTPEVMESIDRATRVAIIELGAGFAVSGGAALASAVAAAMDKKRLAALAAAGGALGGLLEIGPVWWHARKQAVRKVLAAELSADNAKDIVNSIIDIVKHEMDERAEAVEKFVN